MDTRKITEKKTHTQKTDGGLEFMVNSFIDVLNIRLCVC